VTNVPGWRQRKKTATRDRIRACALRLFREQGYDAATGLRQVYGTDRETLPAAARTRTGDRRIAAPEL
jgi:hypothetical protein